MAYIYSVTLALLVLAGGLRNSTPLYGNCAQNGGWSRLVNSERELGADITSLASNQPTEILSIAADFDEVGSLFIAGRDGLYRTQNCGADWAFLWQPSNPRLYPITTLQSAPYGRLYIGSTSVYQPLLISDNGGRSMREGYRQLMIISMESAPSDRDVAYVFLWHGGGTHYPERRIRRTLDGGVTWERLAQDTPPGVPIVDPLDPSSILVLDTTNSWQSTNGAESFELVSNFSFPNNGLKSDGTQERLRTAAFSADGTRIWAISDDGQRFFESSDRGQSWWQLPDPPTGSALRRLEANPHDPRELFALTSANEIWVYRDPVEH